MRLVGNFLSILVHPMGSETDNRLDVVTHAKTSMRAIFVNELLDFEVDVISRILRK
jgi:hypothetical protein